MWIAMPIKDSINTAIDSATARLGEVSSHPRRDAELLLMHVLDCDLATLLTHPDRALSPADLALYNSLIERRLNAEPIQYIIGEQEFYGLSFRVTPDVLIPRPETEHLVEALLERINSEDSEDGGASLRIVDVGTGSGAIAVAIAHALPRSELTAVDLSSAALSLARQNAERHGVSGRMRFVHSDLLNALDGESLDAGFDAIIANPPYIADGEVLERQVRDYEPHAALYAGPTGLEVYERLIPQARNLLRPGGWLMLEIGHGQKSALRELLRGWAEGSFKDDLQGIPRVVVARR